MWTVDDVARLIEITKKRILTYLFLPLVADRSQTLLCLFVYYMNIKDFSYSRLCNNLQGANGPSDIRGR